VNLGGDYFDGITFLFPPGTTLAAGARVIIGAGDNTNAFMLRYPTATNIAGWFSGRLSNSRRENLPPRSRWPHPHLGHVRKFRRLAHSGGRRRLLAGNRQPGGDPNDPANWRTSTTTNGTPASPRRRLRAGPGDQ